MRFPHSKPDTAASVKPRCEYEEFFSISDPPQPVSKFMNLYPRISEIQPNSSERAARLSRESRPLFKSCLSGAGRYRSVIILIFVTNAFSIQTIHASVVRSPYRNPVRLPLIFRIGAAGARCARDFSRRLTVLLVLFLAFGSVTR